MAAEKNFENRVKKFLKDNGAWYVKYWSGSARNGMKFTKDGIPDLLTCVNGYFVGIELKAPTGKATELQIHHLKMIHEAGGFAVLLYPDQYQLFQNLVFCLNAEDDYGIRHNYELLKGRWCKT